MYKYANETPTVEGGEEEEVDQSEKILKQSVDRQPK